LIIAGDGDGAEAINRISLNQISVKHWNRYCDLFAMEVRGLKSQRNQMKMKMSMSMSIISISFS